MIEATKETKVIKIVKIIEKINRFFHFHPCWLFTGNLSFPPIATQKWKRNKYNKINGKNSISAFPPQNISKEVAMSVFSKRCRISTSIYKYIFLLKEKYGDGNTIKNKKKNMNAKFLFRRESL